MSLDPLAWIDESLDQLKRQSLLRPPTTRQGRQTATITLDGCQYVNFSSNDYLGLADDPRIAVRHFAGHPSGWLGKRCQPARDRSSDTACKT